MQINKKEDIYLGVDILSHPIKNNEKKIWNIYHPKRNKKKIGHMRSQIMYTIYNLKSLTLFIYNKL